MTPDPSPSGKWVRECWSGEMESDPGVQLLISLGHRRSAFSRAGSLPSSEAEARGAVEGFDREPSSEAEITPRVRGGCGRAVLRTWAACWASLSHFPFFQIRRRLQAFVGPVAQHAFIFRAILVP